MYNSFDFDSLVTLNIKWILVMVMVINCLVISRLFFIILVGVCCVYLMYSNCRGFVSNICICKIDICLLRIFKFIGFFLLVFVIENKKNFSFCKI